MMNSEKLTNLQHELLKLFQYDLSEQQLIEVKQLLVSYFANKATVEMDKIWNERGWNEETMRQLAKEHTRVSDKL